MNESDMQHGTDWTGQSLAGWFLSEKMNGCRAYWDGRTLWSRGGIAVQIPARWREFLPSEALDCELYDGIDGLYRCGTALRYGRFTDSMHLIVHDVPEACGDYAARMRLAAALVDGSPIARCVAWRQCADTEDALRELTAVQGCGGEGLMLRHPDLLYHPGRTRLMLKLKDATLQ